MAYGTLAEARDAIVNSSKESCVYIGCDSVRFKKKIDGKTQWFARYTTIVVLHYDGCHGARLFQNTETIRDFGADDPKKAVRLRMMTEVGYVVQAGLELVDAIGDRKFEIHLDINNDERHASHTALKEARGYILGTFGIEPKFKPDAPAATHGADHIVRGK